MSEHVCPCHELLSFPGEANRRVLTFAEADVVGVRGQPASASLVTGGISVRFEDSEREPQTVLFPLSDAMRHKSLTDVDTLTVCGLSQEGSASFGGTVALTASAPAARPGRP